jgi:hypothetical protein
MTLSLRHLDVSPSYDELHASCLYGIVTSKPVILYPPGHPYKFHHGRRSHLSWRQWRFEDCRKKLVKNLESEPHITVTQLKDKLRGNATPLTTEQHFN